MEPLFTWIHLSDLHVGHGDAPAGPAPGAASDRRQSRLLQALRDDLIAQGGQHLVNAIFITGDIARGGQAGDYAAARAWLDDVARALGLGPGRIFTVPGNHDVDRSADRDPAVARIVTGVRAGESTLDAVLTAERERLAARMSPYLEFAAELAPAVLAPPARPPVERLFWQHRERHGRLRVRLLGLNTALLSADDHDQGQLALGKEQRALALTARPGELVVALSHHHLQGGWLADEDDVNAWLHEHVHVHLFGHVHDAPSEEARSGTGTRWVRIAVGASHAPVEPPSPSPSGPPAGYGYAIVSVLGDANGALSLRLWPRRWSPASGDFGIDVESVPDGGDHTDHPSSATVREGDTPVPVLIDQANAWPGSTAPSELPILLELLDAVRDGFNLQHPILIELDAHPLLDDDQISFMTERIQKRVRAQSMPGAIPGEFAARIFANHGDAVVYLLRPRDAGADRARPITLGRSRSTDVRVPANSVSSHHADLQFDPGTGEYSIIDRGSRNGTFLNSEALAADVPHRISSGDRLQLAKVAFLFIEPPTLRALAEVAP
jgi:hypothetical protein